MRPRFTSLCRTWSFAAAVLAAALSASPGEARDCRRADVPPGVRLAQQVGCKPTAPERVGETARPSVKAGRRPGFIDLGNGTELRISGDAGIDAHYRR